MDLERWENHNNGEKRRMIMERNRIHSKPVLGACELDRGPPLDKHSIATNTLTSNVLQDRNPLMRKKQKD